MSVTYVKLDYAKIAKDHVLSLRRLVHWFCSKEDIKQGFGSIEGEGDKYTKDPRLMLDMMGRIMPAIVSNDPRKLYEFFDDHNIRISISEHPDSINESILFTHHNSVTKTSSTAINRHEAEQNAFYEAFKLLEARLCKESAKTYEDENKEGTRDQS